MAERQKIAEGRGAPLVFWLKNRLHSGTMARSGDGQEKVACYMGM
jgi:hypothetical protein